MIEDLVSIIVPVYNVENYLEKCIDSIRNQSYKNLEIIIVNDGSTDASGDICNHLSKVDNRIKVIHKTNGGLSDARNYGLDIATGDYIAFIDSDDYIDYKYIETLINCLKNNDSDIAISNYLCFTEGESPTIDDNQDVEALIFNKHEGLKALFDNSYKYQFTTAWGKIFKHFILENFRFPVGRNYEDSATAHLLISRANKIVYINRKQYFYLNRKTSITKSDVFLNFDVINAAYDRVKWFEEKDYKELLIKARIQYVLTLMGVYSRLGKSEAEKIKREEIYQDIKKYIKIYPEIINDNMNIKLRIRIFIILPEVYRFILKKIIS